MKRMEIKSKPNFGNIHNMQRGRILDTDNIKQPITL